MKSFNRLTLVVLGTMVGVIALFNLLLPQLENNNERLYIIEINRFIALHSNDHLITNQSIQSFMETSESLSGISFFSLEDDATLLSEAFTGSSRYYRVWPHVMDGHLRGFFQFQLVDMQGTSLSNIQRIVNGILFSMILIVALLLIYIRRQILVPFNEISHLPIELSKGNVKKGIPESKSRYFGNFIWGLNMMRDTLSAHKTREISLMKEKKTMILSISHDINTPLSAIKLGTTALLSGLYSDENKQQEVLKQISEKTVEIQHFVADIVKISKEDLFAFEVQKEEFYLADVVQKITVDYREILAGQKTTFKVAKFSNRLLLGDFERLVEVIQNLIENAIKYGDGVNVGLSFKVEEDCQLITITNTGNSLAEKELVYLFESFWRGSNVKNAPGSGLGLHICRQLMRQMDGEIYAQICDDNIFAVTVVVPMV